MTADVIVAGAGVMGLWTALRLRERGLSVTVVDPWEPGHARATSSSETRVIRCIYGGDALYTEWAWKALREWPSWEQELGRRVFYRTGVLWMARDENGYEQVGGAELQRQGIPLESLSPVEAAARFPQISMEGIRFTLFEPQAGALLARESMRALAELFVRRGGRIERGRAVLAQAAGGRLGEIECGTTRIAGGAFVFACGPWLPEVLPDVVGTAIQIRRVEELLFGVEPGDERFDAHRMPTWVEIGGHYGTPVIEGRAFKVGVDEIGPEFDPNRGERLVSPERVEEIRRFVAMRFPGLAHAPLVDSRVCQYELTVDEHLVIDQHPALSNVWIVGGGSGHAFKFGPVLGDYVASVVTGAATPEPRFRLAGRAPHAWRQP